MEIIRPPVRQPFSIAREIMIEIGCVKKEEKETVSDIIGKSNNGQIGYFSMYFSDLRAPLDKEKFNKIMEIIFNGTKINAAIAILINGKSGKTHAVCITKCGKIYDPWLYRHSLPETYPDGEIIREFFAPNMLSNTEIIEQGAIHQVESESCCYLYSIFNALAFNDLENSSKNTLDHSAIFEKLFNLFIDGKLFTSTGLNTEESKDLKNQFIRDFYKNPERLKKTMEICIKIKDRKISFVNICKFWNDFDEGKKEGKKISKLIEEKTQPCTIKEERFLEMLIAYKLHHNERSDTRCNIAGKLEKLIKKSEKLEPAEKILFKTILDGIKTRETVIVQSH